MADISDTIYSIDRVREDVAAMLARWFVEHFDQAHIVGPEYETLWQTMFELSQAGGKRIRPYLTVLSYQAFGGKNVEALLPAAAAQELLHLSLLVHDDIIDRDTTRYGRPNITGTYQKLFAKQTDDAAHYAMSAALLAGDLLLSGSYELTGQSTLPPAVKSSMLQLLSRSIFDVGGGEFLDTLGSFTPIQKVNSLHIAEYKTARYSFVTPLLIGATAAGASEHDKQILAQLGRELGIAYQLSDDMLGVFGDPRATGKPNDSDIRERKRTYLLQQTYMRCSDPVRTELDQLLTDPMTDEMVARVRTHMKTSGAKMHVEHVMQECAYKAEKLLAKLDLAPSYTAILTGLIAKAVWRSH